jgi:hypothetical protein
MSAATLFTAGPLAADERTVMREHPLIGDRRPADLAPPHAWRGFRSPPQVEQCPDGRI